MGSITGVDAARVGSTTWPPALVGVIGIARVDATRIPTRPITGRGRRRAGREVRYSKQPDERAASEPQHGPPSCISGPVTAKWLVTIAISHGLFLRLCSLLVGFLRRDRPGVRADHQLNAAMLELEPGKSG